MLIWLLAVTINLILVLYCQIKLPLFFGLVAFLLSLIVWILFSGSFKKIAWALMIFFFVSAWYNSWLNHFFSWHFPKKLINQDVLVRGYIVSLPKNYLHWEQFTLQLQTVNHQRCKILARLNWYFSHPKLHAGDHWRFWVHLKPAHGLLNPGSFDYRLWLFAHGIRATGYVVSKRQYQLLHNDYWQDPLDRIREHIAMIIQQAITNKQLAAIIAAVSIGSRNNMSAQQWQVFQKTGTSHLIAISGLHIGLLATGSYFLFMNIWRLWPSLLLYFPAQQFACLAAMLIAFCYALLSGFSLPTQRAMIMIAVMLISQLRYHTLPSIWRIQFAWIIILLLQPFAVFTASFWLSFVAVFCINYGMGAFQKKSLLHQWLRLQWILFIGLLPLSLYFFQRISLMMFIANLIAVPWLGMVIVPFGLFACCLCGINLTWAKYGFYLAAAMLAPLWWCLQWLAKFSWATFAHALPSEWVFLVSLIGVLLCLAPQGFPGRFLAICWFLPLFLFHLSAPKWGEIWMTVLDVGQGLAIVVRTMHHTLLYDTGPSYTPGFDAGKSVILPYLRYQGITDLDSLVISHGDNDHIGGAASILKYLRVANIVTSVPNRFPSQHAHYCHVKQHWQWDGVRFEMLYPEKNKPYEDNNSSCVLKVSNHQHAILLTGDIEKSAEQDLLLKSKNKLAATVLSAPHHGSKTSSSHNFVRAVHPQYVIFSTGYYNRYHLPSQQIMKKYQQIDSYLYNTANTGEITIRLLADGQVRLVTTNQAKHYFSKWQRGYR